ncbi:MAG: hypothetical protein IAF38_05050 [Bacteroidia bacterium]|nr:hypothetical protein [Bacteroidia bacterium]
MKTKQLRIFFLLCEILLSRNFSAQCSGGTNAGAITPTTAWQTITVQGGKYFTFTVPAGSCNLYDFSFCQGGGSCTFDSQITIRTNADVYANGYSDDACGLSSQILSWSPPSSGTYRVLVSQYSCTTNSTNATLAYRYAGAANNGDYQYLNNATVNGTCINLTPASNNQLGCAWDANSTLNFASNFSYDFTVNLGSSDAGADGIAFVMQNDPLGRCVCGTAGGALGAGGITNSLIVELDTYLNTEDRDDGMAGVLCAGGPEPDHLDIWQNGVVNPELGSSCVTDAGERVVANGVPLMSGLSIYNIENGLDHKLRIAWNSGTTTLTASVLDNTAVTTYGTISYVFNPITVFGTNTPFFGFTGSTGGLNNSQYFCNPPILLPVELVEFSVACNEFSGTTLHWKTASEFNNDFFTVERTTNGIDFTELTTINAEPNSAGAHEYFCQDTKSPGGQFYYRLSQTDFSGKKTFYPLQEIRCEEKKELKILALNNSEGQLDLVTVTKGGMYSVKIFDAVGKMVFSTCQYFSEGKSYTSIPLGFIKQGIYFLSLDNGCSKAVSRFVK